MSRHTFYPDLGDLKRPSRIEKVLDYLTAAAFGAGLGVLLVLELSK